MNEWRCFTYTHTHVWILFNQEIKPVHSRGNQSWIFIGRTDAEAEAPIFWPPDMKNGLIGKDPEVEKNWRQEETRMTEDEMVGWYHWFNGHEFEQVPGVGDGQGSLARCSPWGRKELDMTERLNWTELNYQTNRKKETLPFAKIWMDLEGQGNRKNLVKQYKLSITRWLRPEGPMYNTMTIADNTTLYNWNC